jgi:DNA-binding response OmpR family regulator
MRDAAMTPSKPELLNTEIESAPTSGLMADRGPIVVLATDGDVMWARTTFGSLGSLAFAPPDRYLVAHSELASLIVFVAEKHAQKPPIELVDDARRRGIRAPLLVVGRSWTTDDIVALLEAGADDCLRDVPDYDELRARARSLLRRSFGDWPASAETRVSLDSRQLTFEINGRQIALTRSQFSILCCLVSQRGRWCSPDFIMNEALGIRHYKGNSLVRFHMHNVRRALGRDSSLVQWERGKGYKFAG